METSKKLAEINTVLRDCKDLTELITSFTDDANASGCSAPQRAYMFAKAAYETISVLRAPRGGDSAAIRKLYTLYSEACDLLVEWGRTEAQRQLTPEQFAHIVVIFDAWPDLEGDPRRRLLDVCLAMKAGA